MLNHIQVVEDISSCLGDSTLEITQHIANNHMEMCRFNGLRDSEYQKVAAALDKIQKRISGGYADLASPSS